MRGAFETLDAVSGSGVVSRGGESGIAAAMSTLELPVGTVLAERFRVFRRLGAGGMGAVFEAVDQSMDRPVALKVLHDGAGADPQQLARFEREARAAARLSHPNVVGVSELVRDAAVGPILVMELLPGRSLASRIQEQGPLPESEVVTIGLQALDGLAAAHAAGMVHRDLKPSNVFLVPLASGVLVKVLDFGIVKMLEEGALPKLTQRGMVIGTPMYMSPEQLRCDPVDARSDVYSMGACLYEALAGVSPYAASHTLELIASVGRGPPRDVVERRPGASPDLCEVIRVAMARDPSQRYQSAAAMRAALGSAVLRRPGDAKAAPFVRAQPDEATIDARPARAPQQRVDLGVVKGIPPTAVHAPPAAPAPRPAPTPPPALPVTRRPAALAGGVLAMLAVAAIAWWIAHRPAPRALAVMPPSAPVASTAPLAPPPATAIGAPPVEIPRALDPPASGSPRAAPLPAHRPRHGTPPPTSARPASAPPVSAPPATTHRVSPIGHELMDPFQ
ncbi:MAG: protein kinase [Sandaracinus sp.]